MRFAGITYRCYYVSRGCDWFAIDRALCPRASKKIFGTPYDQLAANFLRAHATC